MEADDNGNGILLSFKSYNYNQYSMYYKAEADLMYVLQSLVVWSFQRNSVPSSSSSNNSQISNLFPIKCISIFGIHIGCNTEY